MPFEKFSRSTARTETGAKWLSIQGNGSISLSYTAMKAIGLPPLVHLFFDADTSRIAIKAAPEESRDAYQARLQGRRDNPKGARVISSSAFFKYIGLDSKKASRRYDATIEDDMIIAQLDTEDFTIDVDA